MRKITKEIVNAWLNGESKKIDNTESDGTNIFLHGNMIVMRENGKVSITHSGYPTRTTFERLKGIPGVNSLYTKNWQVYLNDKPWDGFWTELS